MSLQYKRDKKKLYLDSKKSVIRFLTDSIREMKELGFSNNLTFIDLDAHADLAELDSVDYVCLQGFSAKFDEKFVSINFNIGVTTFDDKEKTVHDQIVSYLTGKVVPLEQISLLDSDTGKFYGKFIINEDTEVSPFAKTNVRSLQFILVTALSTETIFH